MTIQNNGIEEEPKHSNEPLDFIKEENKFIEMSFRIIRSNLDNSQVQKLLKGEELDIDNKDHVRKVIKLYHDRFRMPPGKPHQLKDAIFEKLGYWHDGITTLEDHERKLVEEKMANEKRLAEMEVKRKEALEKQIKLAQEELEQIKKDPSMYKLDLTQEYEKIEKQIQEQVEKEKKVQTLKIQQYMQQQQEDFKKKADDIFLRAEQEKKKIQELAYKKAISERKNKLTKTMTKIEKITPTSTLTENKIKERNKEIDFELKIDDMTVKELREFANENNIQWTYHMRKQDLVNHIKNEV